MAVAEKVGGSKETVAVEMVLAARAKARARARRVQTRYPRMLV